MGFYQDHCIYLPAMAGWFFFSALLSSYNKYVFGRNQLGFPCPLLMTSIHFLAQWIVAETLCSLYPQTMGTARIQQMNWIQYLCISIPCGFVTSGDVGLSNLAMVTLSISFYTMVKASTPIFVLGWAYLFGIETITWSLLGVVCVIAIGEFLTVAGEHQYHHTQQQTQIIQTQYPQQQQQHTQQSFHYNNTGSMSGIGNGGHNNNMEFQWHGLFLCLGASMLSGARWTLVQLKIQSLDPPLQTPVVTMRLLAPTMFISLFLISCILEQPLTKLSHMDQQDRIYVLGLGLFGAFFATAMILCEFYLIMKASAMILMIGGVMKEMITIFIGVLIFHDPLNQMNLSGCFIVFLGVLLYKFTFHQQQRHQRHQPIPTQIEYNDANHDIHDNDHNNINTIEYKLSPTISRFGRRSNSYDSGEDEAAILYPENGSHGSISAYRDGFEGTGGGSVELRKTPTPTTIT